MEGNSSLVFTKTQTQCNITQAIAQKVTGLRVNFVTNAIKNIIAQFYEMLILVSIRNNGYTTKTKNQHARVTTRQSQRIKKLKTVYQRYFNTQNTMNKRKTSYEYKKEKIAKLEKELKELTAHYESEFLKRKELEKELQKYKAEPEIERGCETCRHTSLPVGSEKCIKCWKTGKLPNWQPKEDPKLEPKYKVFYDWNFDSDPSHSRIEPEPVDPYQVFRDALRNGKGVEYKNDDGVWQTGYNESNFSFKGKIANYRIKPEPVYIPFTFDDAEMLIGKAVKEKMHGVFGIVTWVLHDQVEIGTDPVAFSALLEWYTFLDGSPCGKLAE